MLAAKVLHCAWVTLVSCSLAPTLYIGVYSQAARTEIVISASEKCVIGSIGPRQSGFVRSIRALLSPSCLRAQMLGDGF